uniref:Uncharacterized protein n=1 Tax=Anguilla anguilla TaxID=7936 RepID=A0A0E9X251_ANGAN
MAQASGVSAQLNVYILAAAMSSGFFYTHEIPMTFHPNLHLSQHLDFHILWVSNKVVQSELCHKTYIVYCLSQTGCCHKIFFTH